MCLLNNIVILVSGDGSNLQAIIDACNNGHIAGKISAVISNNQNAFALQRAANAGINTHIINPKQHATRHEFDLSLITTIEPYQPKLIVLAGYMRILSPIFVQQYLGRLMNIHPSLLPKYPGLNTHQQVIEQGDVEHGSSIHFVTEQLDSGPMILQSKLTVTPADNIATLTQRIKSLEHQIYPVAINWFMSDRLQITSNQVLLDGHPIILQHTDF